MLLGLTFAGVYLVVSLGFALLAVAALLFLDLLSDLVMTGREDRDGRARRTPQQR